MRNLVVSFAVVACLLISARGGEVLLNQKLGEVDVANLPAGWSCAEPASLKIVDEPGRGKVLKVANAAKKTSSLTLPLDVAKVADKTLTVIVTAKFPGNYTSAADNAAAFPKVVIESKDAGGRTMSEDNLVPLPEKPDWQTLKKIVAIPAGPASVTITATIPLVECEVFFDTVVVEGPGAAAPDVAKVAPAPPQPAPAPVPPAPPTPATPAPAAGDPNDPKVVAAKAPTPSLENGGMIFGPEYALHMIAVAGLKKAEKNSLLLIGPGFGEKEVLKISSGWKVLPLNPKLVGIKAQPRVVLAGLPEILIKEKPEVVLVSTDTPTRKPTATEAEDWEDVAHLCERFGATPAFLLNPAPPAAKDENLEAIVSAVKKARELNTIPAVASVPAETLGKRVNVFLTMLETYVFMRGPDPSKATKPRTGPADE